MQLQNYRSFINLKLFQIKNTIIKITFNNPLWVMFPIILLILIILFLYFQIKFNTIANLLLVLPALFIYLFSFILTVFISQVLVFYFTINLEGKKCYYNPLNKFYLNLINLIIIIFPGWFFSLMVNLPLLIYLIKNNNFLNFIYYFILSILTSLFSYLFVYFFKKYTTLFLIFISILYYIFNKINLLDKILDLGIFILVLQESYVETILIIIILILSLSYLINLYCFNFNNKIKPLLRINKLQKVSKNYNRRILIILLSIFLNYFRDKNFRLNIILAIITSIGMIFVSNIRDILYLILGFSLATFSVYYYSINAQYKNKLLTISNGILITFIFDFCINVVLILFYILFGLFFSLKLQIEFLYLSIFLYTVSHLLKSRTDLSILITVFVSFLLTIFQTYINSQSNLIINIILNFIILFISIFYVYYAKFQREK